MKLVAILTTDGETDVLDAHLAFHLNAGTDLIIAADEVWTDDGAAALEPYVREGYVVRAGATPRSRETDKLTTMARAAATEHGADWVFAVDVDEFWWPRGESLKDVLGAIPPRYRVVQGLVRVFPPRNDDDQFFAERMVVRPSLMDVGPDDVEPLNQALRPIYRADPHVVVNPDDPSENGRRVPLRAWYPIEVMRFPFRSFGQAERKLARSPAIRTRLEANAVAAYRQGRFQEWWREATASDASLVRDERLRDALRALRDHSDAASGFARPAAETALTLDVPNVVDDAAYAVECAAIREVDFEPLTARIAELENRITQLEAGFWPRVASRLSRLVPKTRSR